MATNNTIRVNRERLQQRLEEIAQFGKTVGGGVTRVALTEEDRQGRNQLIEWFRQEECEIRIDRIGNIFSIYPGTDRDLAPVLTGSHGDSQPGGGRFDGILGVIAGLEVVSTLREHGIRPKRDIVVVNWTNEEGSRFTPGCTGSGVWAGKLNLEQMYLLRDQEGKTLGDELEAIGFKGEDAGPALPIHAAYELHVEQGPVLDQRKITIGIPEGIVSPRWYDVEIEGEANHAGSTPMAGRLDALQAFSRIHQQIRQIALTADNLVATVGMVNVSPNSRNVIPAQVHFTIDVRGWDMAEADRVCDNIEKSIGAIAAEEGCTARIRPTWREDRADFNPVLLDIIAESAEKLGLSSMRMYSGASHDMIYINQVAPGAMIFVPSVGGKSHSEIEMTPYEDCAAGADVLLHCLLHSANQS